MPSKISISKLIGLHFIAVLAVLINISNIKIFGLIYVIPLFDLIVIFYFAVFRDLFAIWFLFLLGLYHDSLTGNPLGTTSFCYILLVKIFNIIDQKILVKENFNHIWQEFIMFGAIFLILKWLILSVFNWHIYSFITALIQLLLSSLLYVPAHKFFNYLLSNEN